MKKRDLVVSGMNDACEIITSTMGYKGRSVFINTQKGSFHTVDGATVAGYVIGDGTSGNMGVKLVRDACWKTRDEAGDGTTTTAALIKALLRYINNYHPVEFSNLLDAFEAEVVDLLREELIDFEMIDVAMTSAHGMRDIAETITDAVAKVGEHGTLDLENGWGKIRAEFHDGYYLDEKPFIFFGKLDLQNPLVLIIEQKIEHHSDLIPIYRAYKQIHDAQKEAAKKNNAEFIPTPLVIFASDIYGSAMDMVTTNFKAGVPVVVLRTPSFDSGEKKVNLCQDLQFITDTYKVFSFFGGSPISSFGKDHAKKDMNVSKEFGRARRIISNEKGTVIYFENKDIEAYTKDWEENEWNDQRKAKLTCGVGTIYVGGNTPVEMEYRAHLVDDTIRSCFASRHGVLRGGGLPLYEIADRLNYDFADALKEPRRIILGNAGVTDMNVATLKEGLSPRDTFLAVSSALKNAISTIKNIANVNFVLSDNGEGVAKNY